MAWIFRVERAVFFAAKVQTNSTAKRGKTEFLFIIHEYGNKHDHIFNNTAIYEAVQDNIDPQH